MITYSTMNTYTSTIILLTTEDLCTYQNIIYNKPCHPRQPYLAETSKTDQKVPAKDHGELLPITLTR